MDYHARHVSEDDVLWMHADAYAFRYIEERWLIFKEPCNVKISLAIDGVNPFSELMFIYSVWPNFVLNDNLPP